jgi:hypothetical protein
MTSKDLRKGTTERPIERIIFGLLMIAPLLLSAAVFSGLVAVIWTGVQSAGESSNTLTCAILTEVSARQAVYFAMLSATMYDGEANATIAAAHTAQQGAVNRVNSMFFGVNGDAAANAGLQAIQFGNLCNTLSSTLSPAEAARCGTIAGGVCHSGLHAVFQWLLRKTEALMSARALLAFPKPPSQGQVAALAKLMNSPFVTDMRILELVEVRVAL